MAASLSEGCRPKQNIRTGSPGGDSRRAVGTGRKGCGAVRGTTIKTGPVPPTATGTIQTTGTTTTGFGVWCRPRPLLDGRKQPQAYGPAAGARGPMPAGEDDRDPFQATAIPSGWNGRIDKSPAWCGRHDVWHVPTLRAGQPSMRPGGDLPDPAGENDAILSQLPHRARR
jgi:hypothetical protein